VPAIDGVDRLLAWWLTEVRPQFGDEPAGGQAVLLPSRRHTIEGGRRPACAVTLRDGDQRPEPVELGLESSDVGAATDVIDGSAQSQGHGKAEGRHAGPYPAASASTS